MASACDCETAKVGLPAGYWAESARPMTSLAFIAPLLVVYELGVLMLGPESVRNGADAWLRELLRCAGFGQYLLLPALTVAILLSWHHTTHHPWRLTSGILSGMLAECIFLALGLCLIMQLQGALFEAVAGPLGEAPVAALDPSRATQQAVGYLGAGVYEELLFRLMLLPGLGWTLQRLGASRRVSISCAILATSLLFAAAHYLGGHGEAVRLAEIGFWFTATFRFLAGVFFSLLFVCRGFGIAAGTHAGYDILVGLF